MNGKDYYDYGLSRGVDLNFYGDWQKSYAKMVIHCTNIIPIAANNKNTSLFVDLGTACGLIVRAVKELDVFGFCCGTDVNPYLVDIGRKAHNLSDKELFVHDMCTELPFDDESVTLLHNSQVLEHIDEHRVEFIIGEMKRVLKKDGVAFITIAGMKNGPDEEPTHITIKEKSWWDSKFRKHFKADPAIKLRFNKSSFSPDNSDKNFNHYYGDFWYVYGLRRG
jgi:ubiquinone/menaquinone biosynthesis C-methylase UbiE